MKFIKEKLASMSGSASGVASILGSWQVCHNVCLGLIGFLSILGITVIGMPLAFLTKIAIPLWTIAVVFLGVASYFYFTRRCISKNLLLLNTGLIIAGIPFLSVQSYQPIFWTIGGATAVAAIALIVKNHWENLRKKMRDYIIYAVLFAVIIGVILVLIGSLQQGDPITDNSQQIGIGNPDTTKITTITSGTTNQNDVAIDLTPKGTSNGILSVEISVNTHSVDLKIFDLTKIVQLSAAGKTFFPTSAPSLSGHHNSGILKFDVGEEIKEFTITITGIPKVEKREFAW